MNDATRPVELIVFSDDWGRHPSNCQHLVRCWLRDELANGSLESVTWVNTIGMRSVRLNLADTKRAWGKVRGWINRPSNTSNQQHQNTAKPSEQALPGAGVGAESKLAPRVISPIMWPGFRKSWQRSLNTWSMQRSVNLALGTKSANAQRVVLSTLPIVAGLSGKLDADRWVYLCVDDFSKWPGLDHDIMDRMERQLVSQVDAAVTVSKVLVDRLASMDCAAPLVPHGIDLEHWQTTTQTPSPPTWWPNQTDSDPPIKTALFWGLIDDRLDTDWCQVLVQALPNTHLILVGPNDRGIPTGLQHERILTPGPMPYDQLPEVAQCADVLVMPYRDIPVTQAMQPLKLNEYLASGQPVVVRDLPSTQVWQQACDVVSNVSQWSDAVKLRLDQGIDPQQSKARQALSEQSWRARADTIWPILTGSLSSAEHHSYTQSQTCPRISRPAA